MSIAPVDPASRPRPSRGDGVDVPAVELTPGQQSRLVQALAAALARADGVAPRHIETHISHVLLHDGHAYKLKKAIATSFLDQSTLARRRHACAEELRLNRRLAPDLYLDAVEITGTLEAPRLGGPGRVLDVAVRMREFDQAGLWDRLAARGELCAADIDDLVSRLASFHAGAAAAAPDGPLGSPALVRQALLDSLADLRAQSGLVGWPDAAGEADLARLRAWEGEAFAAAAPVMARRLAGGRVREGHGDLHLGNVAREHGRCLVFDGIEFNDRFRWLDVMDEVGFMAMDLHAHGLPALAHRFVNGYLEACGDYDGLRVLGYYLVHRALVRAKVAQLRIGQASGDDRGAALDAARRYFELALRLAAARPRALVITHGLSGSGKTTLTQGLVEAAGAVRVRADVERKRLAGLAPLQSSRSTPGTGLYTPAMNEATQARVLHAAADVVEGGWPVVIDATFIRRRVRDEAREAARRLGVPFLIARFSAPPGVLRERVRLRGALGHDASEADETVLVAQQQALEPLQDDERAMTFEVPSADAGGAVGGPPAVDWTPLLARFETG